MKKMKIKQEFRVNPDIFFSTFKYKKIIKSNNIEVIEFEEIMERLEWAASMRLENQYKIFTTN